MSKARKTFDEDKSQKAEDAELDEAIEESFPASDPPAITPHRPAKPARDDPPKPKK